MLRPSVASVDMEFEGQDIQDNTVDRDIMNLAFADEFS